MIEESKKTTNQGIEYLRKIGVEKIKEDTHLDTIKITDILEKRFDRLDYVRARGFINILEKEYHLDLSDWLAEYHLAYPQVDNEEQEKREIYSNEVRQKKIAFYLGLLGVCVVLGIVGQMIFSGSFAIFNLKQKASVAEERVENPQASNENLNDKKNEEIQPAQEKQTLKDEGETIKEVSQNKAIYEFGNPVFANVVFDVDNVLYLDFSKPVWVGMVYLDSKKRIAKISKDFEIPLDKELLIYVAYGSFLITLNEDEMRFSTYKPIFLIYTKEGGLRQITKEEFVALNGGVEW